jgi:hypothetical protein
MEFSANAKLQQNVITTLYRFLHSLQMVSACSWQALPPFSNVCGYPRVKGAPALLANITE